MKLSFYVDECLPEWLAIAVSRKRGYRAVHAKADLGYGGRSDEFHFETARKRRQILLTKNRQDFGADRRLLRGHPGVVALVPGDQSNAESVLRARLEEMYACFERNRVGAKPPQRFVMDECRLTISGDGAYLETADGAGDGYV
jgi:hypothetical protein